MMDFLLTLLLSIPIGKMNAIKYSPMKCKEKCLEDNICQSWTVENHSCRTSWFPSGSTSWQRAVPPLFFRRDGGKIIGGRRTIEKVKRDALNAFQKSFELLNKSIPNTNDCKFLELKENMLTIIKHSNESVEEIQSIDSFLHLNDELLEDIFLILSEKVRNNEVKIQENNQQIKNLSRQWVSLKRKETDINKEMENAREYIEWITLGHIGKRTTLKVEILGLNQEKVNTENEMNLIGPMKKSVVSVHVLLESINAGLQYSRRKIGTDFAPSWTFEEFEEAVEEVFIGIKEVLRTMITDSNVLRERGAEVSSSAGRMRSVIKKCEQDFGRFFQLEDM